MKRAFNYDHELLLIECDTGIFLFLDTRLLNELSKLKQTLKVCGLSKKQSNINIVKKYVKSDYSLLANIALLNLKNYNSSEYNDVDFNKFSYSPDKNINELSNKIITGSNDLVFYETIMYLQSVSFFSNIKFQQLSSLAKSTNLIEFSKDEVIINQHDIADSLYIILDGEVEVEVNKKIVANLGTGTCFGEIAIVADVKRTATVRSITSILALKLSAKHFQLFIEDNPKISIKLMKDIVNKLIQNSNL